MKHILHALLDLLILAIVVCGILVVSELPPFFKVIGVTAICFAYASIHGVIVLIRNQ